MEINNLLEISELIYNKLRNGFLLLFFTFQMRPRHFLLPNHAFHHAQLPDAMSRKLVWKMVCVNSSDVGSGCGEQGCTSP